MALHISLASGSRHEKNTRAQLERLLERYDLGRWTFTEEVRIEEGAIPHSHPVLTLNTRHFDDDALLLSTYLHEQLHRSIETNEAQAQAAMGEFHTRYPDLPVGHPRGCRDEESNAFHLIVCALEIASVRLLAGVAEAARVLDFWCGDHYTAIYQLVRDVEPGITEVLARYGLMLLNVIG